MEVEHSDKDMVTDTNKVWHRLGFGLGERFGIGLEDLTSVWRGLSKSPTKNRWPESTDRGMRVSSPEREREKKKHSSLCQYLKGLLFMLVAALSTNGTMRTHKCNSGSCQNFQFHAK